ncbi:hypothetical protein ACO0QE_002783 [Hanseniaspora vineae]
MDTEIEEDYYHILGVSEDSSFEEIKKSYRKLALKHHPDKSVDDDDKLKNEKIFQKISMAYQTLSDDTKRQEYDYQKKYGSSSYNEYGGAGRRSGGGGFHYSNHSSTHQSYPIDPIKDFIPKITKGTKSANNTTTIPVSLKSLYLGNTISLKVERKLVCQKCQGSKIMVKFLEKIAYQRSSLLDCPDCKGHGIRLMSNGFFEYEVPCDKCYQMGVRIPKKAHCDCNQGYVTETENDVPIYIQSGMKNDDTIVLRGKADEKIGCEEAGDLIFKIKELDCKDRVLTRIGNDLYSELTVSLTESLTGFKNKPIFVQLDDRVLVFSTPRGKVLRPNDYLRIKGEGWPHTNGDLLLKINVEFPPDNWYTETNDLKVLETYLPNTTAKLSLNDKAAKATPLNRYPIDQFDYLSESQISSDIKEKCKKKAMPNVVYQEDSGKSGYCSQQ